MRRPSGPRIVARTSLYEFVGGLLCPGGTAIGNSLEPWVMDGEGDPCRAFGTFTPYRRRIYRLHPFLIRSPKEAFTVATPAPLPGACGKMSQVT